MEFKEIVAPSMKELFIQSIENMILSGELKIGDKLPTERELANKMNLSRSVVNLGLNELKNKGFIDIVPRKGTYVADYIQYGTLDTLMSIINFNGGSLDKKIFDSLMEYRLHNEGIAAYLAALNRSDEDIDKMESLYNKMLESNSNTELSTLIFDFHHVIFYATNNYIYPLVHNSFRNISIVLVAKVFNSFPADHVIKDLKTIMNMIKNQNPDRAKEAMENLIKHGIEILEENYF